MRRADGIVTECERLAVRIDAAGEGLLRDLRPWIGSATYSKLEHKSITPPETIEAHDV